MQANIDEQKLQLKVMQKNINKKNMRNQPLRSPSPDIANRSIIKRTTVEIDDIKNLLMMAKQKDKQYELQSSISNITPSDRSFQSKYKQMKEQFVAMKQQLRVVMGQNKFLNQQITILREQSKRGVRQDGESAPKELRERIILYSQENKRLSRMVKEEMEKNQQSNKNNEALRRQILQLRQEIQIGQPRIIDKSVPFLDEKSTFTLMANNLLRNYQQQMQGKLDELNSKIIKLEYQQKLILAQVDKRAHLIRTPFNPKAYEKQFHTTAKKESQYYSSQRGWEDSSVKGSPIGKLEERDTFDKYESTIYDLEQEVKRCQYELQVSNQRMHKMELKIEQYEKIIEKDKHSRISTPKFSETINEQDKFQKIQNLQQQQSAKSEEIVKFKQETRFFKDENRLINDQNIFLKGENKSLKEQNKSISQENLMIKERNRLIESQNANIKDKINNLVNDYNKQRNDLVLACEQQKSKSAYFEAKFQEIRAQIEGYNRSQDCPQCSELNQSYQQIKDKLSMASQRNEELQGLIGKIRRQADVLRSRLQDYQRINQSSQEKLRQLDSSYKKEIQISTYYKLQLKQYILLVENIKKRIIVEQIDKLMNQNTNIYIQTDQYCVSLMKEYSIAVEEFSNKILTQEHQIIQLQRDLSIKNAQNQQLMIQRVKLNNLLQEYKNKLVGNSKAKADQNIKWDAKTSKLISKCSTFIQNKEKIMERVCNGAEKLEILYQKIGNCSYSQL